MATKCQSVAALHLIIYAAQRYGNNNAKAQKKLLRQARASFFLMLSNLLGFLLFEELLVLVVELINTTGAVDELHLTRVEGV